MNTLIYAMGDQADDILRSFALSEEHRKDYATVKSTFDKHFVPRRNVIFERAKFNQRIQQEGEPVESFITALYALAEHCGYGELHDDMIRDRIVVGIRNSALSEKLQLDPELTLAKAATQVRQAEAVKQQQPLVRGKPDAPVGAVGKGSGRPIKTYRGSAHNAPTAHSTGSTARQGKQPCSRCGKGLHTKAQCPARGKLCNRCGKLGHFQAVCRSPAKVGGVETTQTAEDATFLGSINDESNGDDPWCISLTLEGKTVTLHVDTGAEVTVITKKVWRQVGKPELTPPDRTLRGPDSTVINTLGKFTATFTWNARQVEGEVYVAKRLTKSLLGRPTIKDLDLLRIVAAVHSDPKGQFPSLFQGLGKLKDEYHIELMEDAKPFALSTPRRVAIPLMKRVRQELTRMEKMGVISKVSQPTEWCAGMVVVPKTNGRVRITFRVA